MIALEIKPAKSKMADTTGGRYQATGAVLEINDRIIAIQNNTERWEFVRNKETNITDVKVGTRVRIIYDLIATKVGGN